MNHMRTAELGLSAAKREIVKRGGTEVTITKPKDEKKRR